MSPILNADFDAIFGSFSNETSRFVTGPAVDERCEDIEYVAIRGCDGGETLCGSFVGVGCVGELGWEFLVGGTGGCCRGAGLEAYPSGKVINSK